MKSGHWVGPASGVDRETCSSPGATPCGVSISKCGCTIASPGFYDVTATLLDVKLNKDTSCIAIKSPNVVLALNGMKLTGANAGIGVHVLSGANGCFIEGAKGGTNGAITGWDTGILIEANSVVVENLTTGSNGTAGIELNKAKFAALSQVTSNSNTKNGIWLNNSSFNQVIDSPNVMGNKASGILIGCTSGCPKSAKSNQNRIVGNSVSNNTQGGITIGSGSQNRVSGNTVSGNQSGIVIASGSQHNVITGNSASGNSPGDDLMDSNIDCGTNIWFGNTMFSTAEPAPCVH
jgi:parallel beta-helix repeat protein